MLDRVWDYRFPNEKDHYKSQKQKDKQLGIWRRNARILQEYREGLSALNLSKKYGLSLHWTKVILAREERLQNYLSSIPKEKVTVSDFDMLIPTFRLSWIIRDTFLNANLHSLSR